MKVSSSAAILAAASGSETIAKNVVASMGDREVLSGNGLEQLDVLGTPMHLELSGSESRFASDEEEEAKSHSVLLS